MERWNRLGVRSDEVGTRCKRDINPGRMWLSQLIYILLHIHTRRYYECVWPLARFGAPSLPRHVPSYARVYCSPMSVSHSMSRVSFPFVPFFSCG